MAGYFIKSEGHGIEEVLPVIEMTGVDAGRHVQAGTRLVKESLVADYRK